MFTSSEDSKRVSEATAIERLKHTNGIKVGFDLCVPEESTRQEFKLVTFPEKTQEDAILSLERHVEPISQLVLAPSKRICTITLSGSSWLSAAFLLVSTDNYAAAPPARTALAQSVKQFFKHGSPLRCSVNLQKAKKGNHKIQASSSVL
ncbi:hypothetical protein DY000_02003931 [Brassica cretica]|uniref:Uncharacterized protein n=1 Tax=Brassica cretica TaxID=69181 RepID=A0ABQ7CE35_BRACR|nr:hypothetical protein DY000_02003931 [Brassica cretica]